MMGDERMFEQKITKQSSVISKGWGLEDNTGFVLIFISLLGGGGGEKNFFFLKKCLQKNFQNFH